MRALITGATGFIGSHLAEELHNRGFQLRFFIRKSSNLKWIRHLPAELIYGDFFDNEALKKSVADVDYIFHVAGVTKAKTKEEYFRGNHIATKNLLNTVLTTQPNLKRFVHISSQTVTGPSLDDKPVDEQTPLYPITTYGISKMEAEKECLKVMDKFPITIIRPPTVYGPRDTDVFEFFNTISKGLQPVVGFGKKFVSMIHVRDLVEGIILAGEHPKGIGETYFIANERYYHWQEVGDLTAIILNKRVLLVHIPEFVVYIIGGFAELFELLSSKPALLNFEKVKDIVQDAWICDVAKAKTGLGFCEKISLEEGIRNTVTWYRAQGWLT